MSTTLFCRDAYTFLPILMLNHPTNQNIEYHIRVTILYDFVNRLKTKFENVLVHARPSRVGAELYPARVWYKTCSHLNAAENLDQFMP